MPESINVRRLEKIVAECLRKFDAALRHGAAQLSAETLLRNKNPYLFCALGIRKPEELAQELLRAHISSSSETIFGNEVFEPLAKAFSRSIFTSAGGDFVREVGGKHQVISLKSGPKWGNDAQWKNQKHEFNKAEKGVRTHRSALQFQPIMGYCYGRLASPRNGRGCWQLSGQAFWGFLTGDMDFHSKLMAAVGAAASEAVAFAAEPLVAEMRRKFTGRDGLLNWDKILRLNSGISARGQMVMSQLQ